MSIQSLKLLLVLALRNIRRNPRRSLIILSAVILGIVSCTTLSSLARGVSYGMRENSISTLTGHVQIHARGYLDDPSVDSSIRWPDAAIIDALHRGRSRAWGPRVRVPAVIMSERESAGITLTGIDPAPEQKLSFLGKIDAISGEYLAGPGDRRIILGRSLLETLDTRPGKRVVIITQDVSHKTVEQGFKIAGVFDAELESTEKAFVFTGIETAQKMLGLEGRVSEIEAFGEDIENIGPLEHALSRAAPQLEVSTWKELVPFVKAILQVQGAFIKLFFLIVIVTVSFGLINTLFMAIFERTREIGMVEALGMSPLLVMLQVVIESVMLVCGGALAGNCLGYALMRYLSSGVDLAGFARGVQYIGVSRVIYPRFIIEDWVSMNILVVTVGIVSSLYPAWKASHIKPVEALKVA